MSTAIQSPPRPFTVDEYHRMIEVGILGEADRVELLRGRIVERMAQNPPHKIAIPLVQMALSLVLPSGWYLSTQQPVKAADNSEPLPDFSVVRGNPRDYPDGTPGFGSIGLLVEVADSSLDDNRDVKGLLYAETGYPIYWIVNLVDKTVEVYSDPLIRSAYRQRQDFGLTESVPFVLDGNEIARIPVRDLLP